MGLAGLPRLCRKAQGSAVFMRNVSCFEPRLQRFFGGVCGQPTPAGSRHGLMELPGGPYLLVSTSCVHSSCGFLVPLSLCWGLLDPPGQTSEVSGGVMVSRPLLILIQPIVGMRRLAVR